MNKTFDFLKMLGISLGTFFVTSVASAQVPVRIMPLGDSLTEGVVPPSSVLTGGYREVLHSLLTAPEEGFTVDFVGTQTYPNAVVEGWEDGDHEAHGGFKIADIRREMGYWLKKSANPDVVLLHIGTNDFWAGGDAITAQQDLRDLLADLSTLLPHARIIVSSLNPRGDAFEIVQEEFNQSLPGIVAAQAALGRKVTFVDMHDGFGSDPADFSPDLVHPSTSGYAKMAAVWLPAIKSVITPLGTTAPPAIASVEARAGLQQVKVTFSKPINDSDGANPALFTLNELSPPNASISISQASLDASKRVVTLDTGVQTAGTVYALSVSGVRDRLVVENTISPATATFVSRPFVDGSFEQNDVAWVKEGNVTVKDSTTQSASEGQNLVVFSDADSANDGKISQSIPTIPGQKYRVQFDMGVYASNFNQQGLQLTVRDDVGAPAGQLLLAPAPDVLNGGGAPGVPVTSWKLRSYIFTAISASTTITFEDVSTETLSIDLLLDDVRLYALFNDAPVAVNDGGIGTPFLTVSENSGVSPPITVLNNDSDANSDPLTITAAASPNGTVVINDGETLSFTPTTGFSGEATISYTISDGEGGTSGATAWVLVTAAGPFANGGFEDGLPVDFGVPSAWEVTGSVVSYSSQGFYLTKPTNGNWMAVFNPGTNIALSRISQSFVTTIGQKYSVAFDAGLAAGAGNKSQPLSASVSGDLTPPEQLTSWPITSTAETAEWAEPGKSFTFTATNTTTTLTFTVDISSAGLAAEDVDLVLDNVTVTEVNETNQPPVAVADTYSTTVNVPLNVVLPGVLANDTDDGPSALTAVVDSLPNSGGGLVLDPDGSFTYTPLPEFIGVETFSYHASDGLLSSPVATVSITVNPAGPFVNGSFENDTVIFQAPLGWTADGAVSYADEVNYIPDAGNGDWMVVFNPGGDLPAISTLSQTFATVAGQEYTVTFDAGLAGGVGNKLQVLQADVIGETNPPVPARDWDIESSEPAATWNENTFNFIAGSVSTTLIFTVDISAGGDALDVDLVLDDVRVTPYYGPPQAPVAVDDGSLGAPFVTVVEDSGASAGIAVLANDSDPNFDVLTITAASSPNGTVVIDAGTTLIFTPALNFNGATTISYTISDGQEGTASATVFVAVTPVNDAPVAVNDGSLGSPFVTVAEDSAASAPILVLANDTDVELNPLAVIAANSPDGTVAFDAGTSLSFTPSLNFNGETTISYTISDGQGGTASATVFVAVTPVNDAPVAVNDGSEGSPVVTVAEDSGASGSIAVLTNDTDVELDPLTVTLASSPNGTVAIIAETTLSFTPAENFNGPTIISYTISDGQGGTSSATAFVAVTPVNDAPVAVNDGSEGSPFATVAEDSGASAPMVVLANDTDVDLDPLTVTLASSPDGSVAIIAETTLSFTPAENFYGATTISYTISDVQGGTASATVFVEVTPVNDAPVAVNDGSVESPFVTIDEDSGASAPIAVLGNDTDVDLNPLTVTAASSTNGTVVIDAETTLSFTPALDFNGATTISYTISDGQGGTASATVFVAVTPVNDAPVAVNDGSLGSPFVTVAEDSAVSAPILVLANDTDVDLDPLTVTAANSPDGTVAFDAGTSLSFTPALDFYGETTISYTISDGQGGTASATVFVAVTPVNDAPVAVNDGSVESPFVTVEEDSGASGPIAVLANDTDVDLDPLTVTLASSPNGTVAIISETTLSFTPADDFHGATTIGYTISDGQGGTSSATVFVAVTSVNDLPVAVNDGSIESPFVALDEDSGASAPLTVLGNDTDADLDELVVTSASSPNGTVAIISETTLSFTPAENFNGATTVSYSISDGQGGTASATVFVAVTPVNDAPVAVDDGSVGSPFVTVAEDSDVSAPILVLANDTDVELDSLTVTAAASPGGTVVIDAGTSLSFTPALNFNGETTISYTISDGQGGTSSATVFVAVTPVNDAPVAVNDGSVESPFVTVAEDSGASGPIAVLTNDTDIDLDALIVILASSPNGDVAIDSGTTLSFTPAENFQGAATISYTISDGQGGTASATVFVAVTSVNDVPVAVNDGSVESPFVTIDEDSGASPPIAVLGNDTDADLDALTVTDASSPNGAVAIDSGTTLSFTPAENFNGATTISYTIADGQGGTASATVFIAVTPINDAPVAVAGVATVNEDESVNINLVASDVDTGDVLVYEVVSDPANGSVSIVGSVATYVPNPNYHGSDSFTFKVTDSGLFGSAETGVAITVVSVNDSPVADDQSVSVDEDGSVMITLTGGDDDAPSLSFAVLGGPSHGSLRMNGAVATYTPDPDYNGPDSFYFIALTFNGGPPVSAIATVSITVNPINDAPAAIAQSVSLNEDGSLEITLAGSDPDLSDTLLFTPGTPANGSLTQDGAVVTYTPNPNYSGLDSFTFTVDVGTVVSPPATVSITVSPVNDPPVAVDDGSVESPFLTIIEDSENPLPIAVLANDSDADLDPLVVTLASSPDGSVVINPDGTLVFTPTLDFNGATTISYTISDGQGEFASATAFVSVTPVNDAPVAIAQALSMDEDGSLNITLSGSDLDGDITAEELIYTVTVDPSHGLLEVNGRNLVYTPNSNFNGGDSITFKVNDGGLDSTTASVSIVVSPVNDAPVAVNDGSLETPVLTIAEDSVISTPITVLGNDSDVDLDPLTVILADSPDGLATMNLDGTLSFTPALNFNGTAEISYTISDGQGGTATAIAFVAVTAVNDLPVAVDDGNVGNPFVTMDEDSTSAPIAVLANDTDVDPDTLTVTSAESPNGVVTINEGTTLSFAPASDFNGATTISYTVSDGQGGNAGATAHVFVTPVNDLPVAIAASATVNEDGSVNIILTGSDVDADEVLIFSKATDPANGSVTVVDGVAIYVPNFDFNGPDSFTFKVNDGDADSLPATVSVTVTPVDDLPLANAQSVSVNEDGSVMITLTGSDVDGDSLTFTVVAPPEHGEVSLSGAVVTYTPDPDYFGADSFDFYAITLPEGAPVLSVPATVSITVTPVSDVPVAVDDGSVESPFLTVAEDSGASVPIAVLANDTDADLDPLTVTLVASPDGTVAVNPDGTLTFTPTLDFNGATTISYTISDGNGGTSGATVYLAVTPVNDAPLAIAQAVSLDEDGSLAITLSGSDPDGDVTAEDLIYAVTINPLHGTLGVSGRNLVYTPFPDYTGADSITFTVNDGVVDSATAAVSVTVNPVNDAPTALAGSATVSEDGSVNITLTGGDVDAGEVLTFTKVTDPANGSVDVVNGVATYIPNLNYNGPDSFTFKVNDGDVDSLPATVSITVTPVDDAPVANAQSVSVNEDGSLMITLTGSDVDGDALFYTIPGKPPHGNVVLSGAVATYTPDLNYNGPDSINFFVYTIVSGTPVFSPSALVSVTVNPVNDAPVAVNDGGIESPFVTVAEDSGASGPIAVLANDVDVDATSLSVVTATSPNGTVAISDGTTLSFSPATNFNGAATISYTISDGQVESAVATVFVMVTPVNDAPVAVDDGSVESTFVTVAEDSGASAPIMVLGNDTDLDLDVLTVTLASSPNGEVAIDSGTTLSFTPDENFNGATIISYTISDGQGETASATVFITVTPVNDAPVAFAQSVSVDEDTPVEITLTGSDVDGDGLTFQVGTASHGTVSLAGSVVTYTPSANYSGPDSFTFVANDGNVLSAPATVSITVNEVGGDAFTEWLTLYSLTSDPGTDSDNDSISNAVEYVIGGNPATQSNAELLPTVELASANLDGNPGDEDYLVFTYRRTDLARDDPFTAIHVEWSTDLTGPWSDTSGMVEQVTDGAGVDLVKVFIPRSLASGGRLFTRLGVEISTIPATE